MSKILGSVSSTSGGATCLSLKNSRHSDYPFSPWEVELGAWFSYGVLDKPVKGFEFNSYQKANKTRIAKPQAKPPSLLGNRYLNRFLSIPHVIPQWLRSDSDRMWRGASVWMASVSRVAQACWVCALPLRFTPSPESFFK